MERAIQLSKEDPEYSLQITEEAHMRLAIQNSRSVNHATDPANDIRIALENSIASEFLESFARDADEAVADARPVSEPPAPSSQVICPPYSTTSANSPDSESASEEQLRVPTVVEATAPSEPTSPSLEGRPPPVEPEIPPDPVSDYEPWSPPPTPDRGSGYQSTSD